MAVSEELKCAPLNADDCRADYHCGIDFPKGWRGTLTRVLMRRELNARPNANGSGVQSLVIPLVGRNVQRHVIPQTADIIGGVRSHMRTGLRAKFPANRENNREYRDSGPSEANFVARNRRAAATFYEIPYAN